MNSMLFSFLTFLFNFFFVLVRIFIFYFLLICFYAFKMLLNLPFDFLFLGKSFFFLILNLFNRILRITLLYFSTVFSRFFSFYIKEGWVCFSTHFKTLFQIWNKVLKWVEFYRILLKVIPNFSVFLKLLLKVETNSLVLGNWFQLLAEVLERLKNLYEGRTRRAYNFRLTRRIIKFILGLITLIYPFGLLIKLSLFNFARFLFFVFSLLKEYEILGDKNLLFGLKFIIWFKIFFVWKSIPFEILFDYGISKKYPQFEDVQPDIKTISSDVWDYALERYCYFDEDLVLNKFYIFNIFRIPVRYLTSFLGACLILPYLFFKNFYLLITLILLIIYIPFIFFWLHAPITVFFYIFKLPFTFIYFIPVFFMFLAFIIIFSFYKMLKIAYKKKLSLNFFNFIKLTTPAFKILPNSLQIHALVNFLIFKIKKLTLYKDNKFAKYLFSLNGLLKINETLEKLVFKFSNNDYKNSNILGYNSSYVFKRVRSYTLRFKNFQFIKNFLKSYNIYRLTPDQIKAFNKIALNNYYPVYYFEKLFYTVYSKAEQELETPYYWAFTRQAFSSNQYILPPRFHVYGFLNFLNFFWNYFSFLNNKSFINTNIWEINEFIQLFNSSYGRVFSSLINDFLSLTKTKKLFFYVTSSNSFLRLYSVASSTLLYLLPQRHYDILIKFYWFYLEPPLVRLLFIYYLHINTFKSIKIYNILHEHISYSWYTFTWSALTEFDRIINETFYSSLKFERFYEINYEKARGKYELFVLQTVKAFFTRTLSPSTYRTLKRKPYLPLSTVQSLKTYERRVKFVENKYKDIDQYLSSFFSTSFKFWNYFFQFMTDNVFEFLAKFYDSWHDVKAAYVTSWASNGKNKIFILFFVKSFILIWLFIILLSIFSSIYLIKSIFIKIFKILKKYA